jgi:hypothetical protein
MSPMKYYLLALLTIAVSQLHAQTRKMSLVARVQPREVCLKWFPADYEQLKLLVEKGATVSRVELSTMQEPGTVNYDNAVQTRIEPADSRYQALDPNAPETAKIASLLEPFLSAEQPTGKEAQNFAFVLATLENSISATFGKVIGCELTDLDVEKNKIYAYRVRIEGVPDAYITVRTNQPTAYPEIDNLVLTLDKKNTVELKWKAKKYTEFGYGFLLEKSLDAPREGSYLTETPYVPARTDDELPDKDDFFRDEQLTEGKTHYYRLVGLNYFGERAMFSEWKKIYVPNHVHAEVSIDSIYAQDATRIVRGMASGHGRKPMNIAKYILLRSSAQQGRYEVVETRAFADSVFSFTVPMPKTGDQFYYKVAAASKDNDSVVSLSYYFFTLDQEPPAKPAGLTGTVDSSGIVRLVWTAPPDNDLQGYRIYRANARHEDFTERNTDLSLQTAFTDTLRLDNLTSEVYYCLRAVDKNYNNSDFSDTLLLIKPDTIAPVAALLSRPLVRDSIISLSWINSPSADIALNYLIRDTGGTTDTLTKWTGETAMFTDRAVIPGKSYSYRIVTSDKSSNRASSQPRQLVYEPGYRKPLPAVKGAANRNAKSIVLNWTLPEERVFSFQIYRAENGSPLSLIKTVEDPACVLFTDKDISIGETYVYTVKYILTSGIHSLPSERIAISY